MYRIAVLAEEKAERQYYAEIIARFCEDKGIFPKIMQYGEQESFFEKAAEHLRSLCPTCRIIWCSDLDFSLHAFRLRADFFLLKPVSEEAFQQGLNTWIK